MVNFSTLNPDFRNKTDLLFFTNRLDLDLANYKSLFEIDTSNVEYLLDRFFKGVEVFWDNLEDMWAHRFETILALGSPAVTRAVEKLITKRMATLLRKKQEVKHSSIEYIQYLEMVKTRWKRKESLSEVRNYLLELPDSIKPEQVILIIKSFIPYVFKDINEYISNLCKRVIYSTRNLIILKELKKKGFDYNIDLLKERMDIILDTNSCTKMNKAFVALLYEPEIVEHLKTKLNPTVNVKILDLLDYSSFKEVEVNNYYIFRVLTTIDAKFTPLLLEDYIELLIRRGNKHLKSNANKIAKLTRHVPAFLAKDTFRYLVSTNRLNYIKALTIHFPEYKGLIPFI